MNALQLFAYVIVPGLVIVLALGGYGLAVWATSGASSVRTAAQAQDGVDRPAAYEDTADIFSGETALVRALRKDNDRLRSELAKALATAESVERGNAT